MLQISGLGAVLSQIDDEGRERVIAYASRTMNKAERNYTISERECLAAVWGVKMFRTYVYGRRFRILTDHQALIALKTMKEPTGRLARWAMFLSEYDMNIQYRSGKKNANADALSRLDEEDIVRIITEGEDPIKEKWREEQNKNEEIGQIKDRISKRRTKRRLRNH